MQFTSVRRLIFEIARKFRTFAKLRRLPRTCKRAEIPLNPIREFCTNEILSIHLSLTFIVPCDLNLGPREILSFAQIKFSEAKFVRVLHMSLILPIVEIPSSRFKETCVIFEKILKIRDNSIFIKSNNDVET